MLTDKRDVGPLKGNVDRSILVIAVAHNPLRASRVPVYTNLIDYKTSHFKQFEGKF